MLVNIYKDLDPKKKKKCCNNGWYIEHSFGSVGVYIYGSDLCQLWCFFFFTTQLYMVRCLKFLLMIINIYIYIHIQGGGWCNDIESCLERAKTRRGSTRYMTKLEVFYGILSNNASLNPGIALLTWYEYHQLFILPPLVNKF